MPTKKDLIEFLERYPDDWPIAYKTAEPNDICSFACQLGIKINGNQIESILDDNDIIKIDYNSLKAKILGLDEKQDELFGGGNGF